MTATLVRLGLNYGLILAVLDIHHKVSVLLLDYFCVHTTSLREREMFDRDFSHWVCRMMSPADQLVYRDWLDSEHL